MGDTNLEKQNDYLKERLRNEPDQGTQPLPFVLVPNYTTFFVEFTVKERDLIIHFFPPEGPVDAHYWKMVFPQCLDSVARSFFNADRPVLAASFVEGVQRSTSKKTDPSESSWWFIAHGFGQTPDTNALVHGFLDQLDQALDKAMATKRA